jgi:hypothetical protein
LRWDMINMYTSIHIRACAHNHTKLQVTKWVTLSEKRYINYGSDPPTVVDKPVKCEYNTKSLTQKKKKKISL